LFFVSTEPASTLIEPFTSPAGETVPCPLTRLNIPFTVARPHMLLLRSRLCDLDGSRIQSPASLPSRSSMPSATAIPGPDDVTASSVKSFGFDNQAIWLAEPYIVHAAHVKLEMACRGGP